MSTLFVAAWLALVPSAAASTAPVAKAAQAPVKPQAKTVAAQAAPQAAKVAPTPQPVAVAQVSPAAAPAATSHPAPAPEPATEAATPQPAAPQAAPQATISPASADWLTQNDAQTQVSEPMQRWPLVVATLLMLAAGGAFLALRVRQGQTFWPGGVGGQAIEILAVKALGNKHRLVLVEACGERLLLSATEREVRLLSHISSQESLAIDAQSDASQVDALTRTMGHQAPRQNTMVSRAQATPSASQTRGAPVAEPKASVYDAYIASEPMAAPMVAPAQPASHESLSAEALYEGAARSMDLDEQDDDLDDAPQASPQESPDTLASDVAGLARWRQAAAQGAETWGKQV